MDFPATQIYEDNDFTPTQQISRPVQDDIQIGVLDIGSETYPIKKGITVIGRHPDCNIILNNQTISKKHAEIEASGSGTSAWICDLNSSNKTKLNNSILRPHRCYELKNGNVLEFGVVQAIYNVCSSLEESLIPETPAPTRQKTKTIIPGTPDSSLNNSSTCGEISMVAGTQANNSGTMFRCPAVPRKSSINRFSNRNSDVQNSSVDDSLDNSQSFVRRRKRNVGESSISIDDMETQKSFETSYETSIDIHDAETQKICVSKMIKDLAKSSYDQETNIHDVETQHEEDIQKEPIDIHDLETQHEDVNIHDMKTPKNIRRNVTIQDNSIRNSGNIEAVETSKGGASKSASCSNDADKDKIEHAKVVKENLPKAPQEYFQLSLTSNFEYEHSELDKSRNLIDPQSLLEDFSEDDDSLLEIKSEPLSPVIVTSVNNESDESKKSSNDENIFDAPTQVSRIDEDSEVITKPIESKFGSISNDSDSTDEEVGVLQNYSYIRNKDNEKSSKSQASDSEDSSTDEEGQFTEIALKIKRLSSSHLEEQANEGKEGKTDLAGVSRDSEDLFDALTQPVNLKTKSSLRKQSKDEVVDFDAPTQVIDKNRPENNVETNNKGIETKEIDDITPTQIVPCEEIDDMAPTQVLPTSNKSSMRKDNSIISVGNKGGSNEEDDTSTAIGIVEKDSKTANSEVSSLLNPLKAPVTHEYSVENIEYEMAPTQRISEIEEQLPTSRTSKNVSRESKVSLNDSIERNLREVFEGINEERVEERVEERPQITTQGLENLLESSQCEDKLSTKDHVDSASPTINKPRKSIRGKKSEAQAVSNKMLRKSNLENADADVDSQNTDSYFSVLTSARKRNVLADSQDLPNEEKSDEQKEKEETSSETVNAMNDKTQSTSKLKSNKHPSTTESVSDDQSRSESVFKGSSTPRLSRKTKPKELKTSKDIPEEVDVLKIDEDKSEEYEKSVDTKASNSSVDGEKVEEASKMLINEDDIFAGLPEVRISGTLSNPPSPTSSTTSEYNINVNHNRAKQTVRIAPKRRGAPRKSQRRLLARNTESVEPCHTVSKANSSTIPKSLSNPFSSNLDGDKRNENEKTDKKSVESIEIETFRRSSRRSKPSDLLPETKSITSVDSKKKGKQQSSFIRSNGRTRNSSKENVDCSSAFQVEKEALTKTAEPAKQNVLNVSRIGKRSLNTMDKVEVGDSKKRKEQVKKDAPATTRSRTRSTIVDRRQCGDILDFVTKANSLICQKLTTGSGNNTIGQSKPQAEEISSEIGEESQEIEMILNGSFNTETKETTEKNTKGARKRARKRGQANVSPIFDRTESSSASSIVYESDNAHFEAPISKPKRAKVSRNTSSAVNITINKSSEEENKNDKRSTRSTRSMQKLSMDSSVKENTKAIVNESVSSDTSKMNNSRDKRQRQKAGKVPANKNKKKETFIEETTSSEMNSSIETSSIPSTPNRTRSSMFSSFITSSPGRTKYRILFTGVTANHYSKLITKLGATQVEDVTKCTVLVTDKVRRTFKFLCALAQSIPIVSVDWLVASEKAKHFVELEDYILKDSEAEARYDFKLEKSLEKAKNHKLLNGYTVVLTRNVVPPLSELKTIIASCGGKYVSQRTLQWPQKAVVISCKEDLSNAKKLLVKAPKSVTIQSTEFILTGILRQELDFTEFKLI